jgi:hypothetical protein
MNANLRHEEFHVAPDKLKSSIGGTKLTDLGDKGIVVDFGEPKKESHKVPHHENLIDYIDYNVANDIGSYIVQAVEDDLNSRKDWENGLAEGIRQLGIKPETDLSQLTHDKAKGVFSSSFMQAFLRTVANIQGELLPSGGPAKVSILGEENEEILDRAERVEKWFNIYLTEINKEFYPDMEQAISWCALYGSVFKKTYFDPVLKRVCSPYIKPQDFVVNYNAASLSNCNRITHILHLTRKELKQRQYSGLYANVDVMRDDQSMDESEVTDTVRRQEGITIGSEEYNELYTLFECHVELDIEGYEHKDEDGNPTGIPLPYIVTVDAESMQVLSIYRNWAEGDTDYKRIECFTHYPYFTGFGFYAYGLAHIAGVSAMAATSILRQLVDAGQFANFPAGFMNKGVIKSEDPTIRLGPGQWMAVDASGIGSVTEAFAPLPSKEPSATLNELLNKIEDGIGNMVSAAEQQFADFNPNAPVGTTLALMEQANRLQSSIMKRLHRSMGDEFSIMYKLFGEYLGHEVYPYAVNGYKHKVARTDFKPDLNVVPVSDPNITSSAQRLIRWEAVRNMAKENPDLFNIRVIDKYMLKEMKVPEIDTIMIPEDEGPKPLDPVSENENILKKEGVVAGLEQNHQAHIIVHGLLLQNPNQDPEITQAAQAHIQEHTAFMMRLELQQKMGMQIPENAAELDVEQQNQIAMQAAQAAQQMIQEMQAQQQQQPTEEMAAMVEAQAMMAEVQVKDKEVELRAQIDMQRLELDRMKVQLEQMQLEEKSKAEEMRLMMDQMKMEQEAQNQEIKLAVEEKKIEQQAKNEELKAETAAFEAQLKYETEQDKIKSKKEELENKRLENLVSDVNTEY